MSPKDFNGKIALFSLKLRLYPLDAKSKQQQIKHFFIFQPSKTSKTSSN
jgi:hypothetical protein